MCRCWPIWLWSLWQAFGCRHRWSRGSSTSRNCWDEERGAMTSVANAIALGRSIAAHVPWPRVVVDTGLWQVIAERLAAGDWTMLGLWGEAGAVHIAVRADDIAVF